MRLCVGVWACLAGPAVAQGVPDLTVTATRLATPTAQYGVSVTAAELERSDSVAEALARLPDAFVQTPGGRSGFGALFLRGADPNFTTVLLEGIPLNNATSSRGGAVNLSELGTAGIARVEVVAGPLSSVLGSGALAGAVNLVVAGGGDTSRFDVAGGVGTRGDWTGVAGWRGPVGAGAGASVTAEYADDGEASPGAAFEAVTVTAKLAARGGTRPDRLVVRFNNVVSRQFPDNSGGAALATIRTTERRTAREWLAGGAYRVVEGGVNVDVTGSYLDRRDTADTPGVAGAALDPFGVPAGSDVSRYARALGQVVARVGDGFAAGAEAGQEWGRSDGFLDFGVPVPTRFRASRTSVAGFAEASRGVGTVTLSGGARVDAIDGFKARATGRVGARLAAAADVAVTASAGTSFKAPSFYALGNPFVGNPDLRAERARSIEAGVAWAPSERLRASVNVFHNRYTDLIDFVADPAPRLVNRALVRTTGVVAAVAVPLGATVDVRGSVQYADTIDLTTRGRLLNRPPWRAGAAVTWRPVAALELVARYDLTDARDDVSVPTGPVVLGGYDLVGLAARWVVRPGLEVRARVDNLLDSKYADAVGFAGPGRRGQVVVAAGF